MDSQQHASQPEAVDHHDQPHSLPQPQFQQQQQQQHPQPIMMPQQPQQLPQQQGDNAAPPHVSPKGTWFTKMVFRSLSIIFDLIIIGVTAYISTHFDVWAIVIIGPPAVFSIIWDVAEAISLMVRRGHRGIHPGAIVGIDLILWLAFVALTAVLGLTGGWQYYYYSSGSSYYYSYGGSNTLYRVAVAFGTLEVLTHLALFIIGCYETNLRNRSPPVIVYSNAPGYPQYPGNHQSMMPQGAYVVPAGYQPYPQYYMPQQQPGQYQQYPQQPQQQQQPVEGGYYAPQAAPPQEKEYYAPEQQQQQQPGHSHNHSSIPSPSPVSH